MPKRNVTLHQAAERMGVSRETLAKWCRLHGAPSDATCDNNGRVMLYLVDIPELRRWRATKFIHGNTGKRKAVTP